MESRDNGPLNTARLRRITRRSATTQGDLVVASAARVSSSPLSWAATNDTAAPLSDDRQTALTLEAGQSALHPAQVSGRKRSTSASRARSSRT
jgi:hypothetical protein